MDPNMVLMILKALDIASALAARLGERDAANEAFVEKVRAIIIDQEGVPTGEQFAELMAESDSLTAELEDLAETSGW